MPSQNSPESLRLLRLPEVLALFPVSRSCWWAGISSGRYPAGIKIGPRTTAWRLSDIEALIASLSTKPAEAE